MRSDKPSVNKKNSSRISNMMSQARKDQQFQTWEYQKKHFYRRYHPNKTYCPSSMVYITLGLVASTAVLPVIANTNDSLSEAPLSSTENAKTNENNFNKTNTTNSTVETFHADWYQQTKNLQSVKTFINSKTQIDPRVKNSQKTKESCDRVVNRIAKVIPQEHHGHITRVLAKPTFKGIVCSDGNLVDQLIPNKDKDSMTGVFNPNSNQIFFSTDKSPVKLDTIQHEFLHADAFNRHNNDLCPATPNNAACPIYPANKENLDKMNQAFDKGDQFIERIEKIWQQHLAGIALKKQDAALLEAARVAISDCILFETTTAISQEIYQKANATLASQASISTNLITNGKNHGPIQITQVIETEGTYTAHYALTDSLQGLFRIPNYVKSVLNSPPYDTFNPRHKLAEREAYTFERLSPTGAAFFYKKAYALRQTDIEQCDPTVNKNQQTTQLKK